jgi:DNA polymerase elongation subunit (family B)
MEQFIRKNKDIQEKSIDFQIIEWYSKDIDEGDGDDETFDLVYRISMFGVNSDGESIICNVNGFQPYYYIKVPSDFTKQKIGSLCNYIEDSYILKKYTNVLVKNKIKLVSAKDIYGFMNDTKFLFVRLVFNSSTVMMKSRYIFKNFITIPGVFKDTKLQLYESNIEPFIKFIHSRDIQACGWVNVSNFTKNSSDPSVPVVLECSATDVFPVTDPVLAMKSGRFLQLSWDIETYSYNGDFPKPSIKQNEIIQIGCSYKYNKDPDFLVKQLFTLKKCKKIDGVVVTECANEKELIIKFVDTVSLMNPDIMYTYNGDTFDCVYVIERAKLFGLEEYILSKLSRLSDVPSFMKKEVFSSGAYGDSDFNRLYIPGRLNFDLLIYFKRNFKFDSYKLNNVAKQIIGKQKNDMNIKDMFRYYKEGDPERIKEIGEYCIHDTDLLQDLVDAKRILDDTAQLSNITYVPASYINVKGQTIKVYSQILRKANKMGYLVPHIAFNKDSYPVKITMKLNDLSDNIIDKEIELSINNRKSTGTITSIEKTDTHTVLEVLRNTEYKDNEFDVSFRLRGTLYRGKIQDGDVDEGSFTGATVLTAVNGLYTENIAVLDFASLYPTIMIAFNLCYSTFVMDEKYLGIKDVTYENIKWNDSITNKSKHKCSGIYSSGLKKGTQCERNGIYINGDLGYCSIHDPLKKTRNKEEKHVKVDVSYDYSVVQEQNGKHKGVVPSLLEDLYFERKKVKKLMNKAYTEGNTALGDNYNALQIAIKVSLNSTYGFFGRSKGNLAFRELGSIVTSLGRRLIEQSKEYTEDKFIAYIKENGLLTTKVFPSGQVVKPSDKEIFLDTFRSS